MRARYNRNAHRFAVIKRLRNNAIDIYFIAEGKIGKYSSGIAVCRSTQNFTADTAAFAATSSLESRLRKDLSSLRN